MPTPTDFSGISGEARVYARKSVDQFDPTGPYVRLTDWIADSVEVGSRDRPSTATIHLNRDAILRGDADDPLIPNDAIFAIGYKDIADTGSGPGSIIFEGIPSLLSRRITGKEDSGGLALQSAVALWEGATASQVFGSWMMRVQEPDAFTAAKLIHDSGVPMAFNPGGIPNRSPKTCRDTAIFGNQIFQPPFRDLESYFPTMPGDFMLAADAGGQPTSVRPRFWTYAQALAYVLSIYCRPNAGSLRTVTYQKVTMDFGDPDPAIVDPPALELDYLWHVLKPILKVEAPGEVYEDFVGPPAPPGSTYNPPFFDTTAQRLLTAKCNNLSIEGMNVIEAVAFILHAAGMGFWIDAYTPGTNIDVLAETIVHKFKVWTPGGRSQAQEGGIGERFEAKLEPFNTPTAGRSAGDILSKNNVFQIDAGFDTGRVVNRPIIVGAPTQYEVTIYLRPGWRPINDINVFFLDMVNTDDTATVQDPGPNTPVNKEKDQALADAYGAFATWISNPEQLFGITSPTGPVKRVRNLSRMLHGKGDLAAEFHDVLRKWVCPTSWRYPTAEYSRDRAGIPLVDRDPAYWRNYSPVDWTVSRDDPGELNPTDIALLHALPVPAPDPKNPKAVALQWPHRARRFLPCLVSDRTGKSIGYKVEISLDREDHWFDWPAFTILEDELGVMLNFDSPFDVRNPRAGAQPSQSNILLAMIFHHLRVRITATIEGSDPAEAIPDPLVNGVFDRSRVFVRRDRYAANFVASQFKDRWTANPAMLVDLLDPPTASPPPAADPVGDPNSKYFYFAPRDDTPAQYSEGNRIQAFNGDWKASGKFMIPWIETGARPGLYVEKLEEGGSDTPSRNIDFRTELGGGRFIAPHIAGVVYTFAQGGHRTLVALEDWRSIAELDVRA